MSDSEYLSTLISVSLMCLDLSKVFKYSNIAGCSMVEEMMCGSRLTVSVCGSTLLGDGDVRPL